MAGLVGWKDVRMALWLLVVIVGLGVLVLGLVTTPFLVYLGLILVVIGVVLAVVGRGSPTAGS